MHALDARLSERAAAAGLALDSPLKSSLLAYYDLLLHWNAKINLTALADPDAAIDRLLLEPVAAARFLPAGGMLMDLGSGGGSPAIPLACALEARSLVMVESKARKAAFLREASRQLGLMAVVEVERFEVVAASGRYDANADVVSMRAVRMDGDALTSGTRFAKPEGQIALFVSAGATPQPPVDFRVSGRHPLLGTAELLQLSRRSTWNNEVV
jgi:16S rRNA (guanine527-N7)-methyltransferase